MRRYALLLHTSLRGIFANKLRSFLTMLGIVIGVAAVLVMISIGNSASNAVTSQIEALGSDLVFVVSEYHRGSRGLTLEDAAALRHLPGVRRVSAAVNAQATLTNGDRTFAATLVGADPEYELVRNTHPAAGRFVTEADVASQSRVVVIGANAYRELFGSGNPIGSTIKVNGTLFTVVGVLEEKGGSGFGPSFDDVAVIPISTAMLRVLGSRTLAFISVQASDSDAVTYVRDAVEQLLFVRHGVRDPEEAGFRVISQADVLSTMSAVTGIMTILLAGIAAISLLVGGIGIMNIMLVSVTERTREIGIRMAVGARRRDILLQFLLESTLLCMVGGAVGVALGIVGSRVVADIGGWTPIVLPSTIALSFFFSAFVGLFFGIYPAARASRLEPIEALRYE